MIYALLNRFQGVMQQRGEPRDDEVNPLYSSSYKTTTRINTRAQRSSSISTSINPILLPFYRRSDSPDSPAYRARGSRRHAARLITRRCTAFFYRFGVTRRVVNVVLGTVALVLLWLWWKWEVHVEIAFYKRKWIESDVKKIEPLAGCFDTGNISPAYNLTAAQGPKTFEVQAGLPLRFGMDCYEFAGTIRKSASALTPSAPADYPKSVFHTYWRSDLVPFGDRQAWMLRSFFATQDLSRARLILWASHSNLSQNSYVSAFLRSYPDNFSVQVVDVDHLARNTALAGSSLLHQKDKRAWVDGDLIRLLVTWEYGGVWVDMDSLLTRDLAPLLEHEFVTQWDCYGTLLISPAQTWD